MKITIRQPLSFSEIGQKDNQEDYVFPHPQKVSRDQCFFILCDGMGGHEHGEVASSTVAEALGRFLSKIKTGRIESADFSDALDYAYQCLDEKDTEASLKKMGTTMTCVCFHEGGALVAHIGDSRIYHIRPNVAEEGNLGILYQSSDHSLVNDLLKAGELTEEEVRSYPHKNIITRAIQPHQERHAKAEMFQLTDIKAGDYFFMCCDGVLEQLTNTRLCEILSLPKLSDQDKLSLIKAECDGNTKDNYTCWLIPIDEAEEDLQDNVAADIEYEVIRAEIEEEKKGLIQEDKNTLWGVMKSVGSKIFSIFHLRETM